MASYRQARTRKESKMCVSKDYQYFELATSPAFFYFSPFFSVLLSATRVFPGDIPCRKFNLLSPCCHLSCPFSPILPTISVFFVLDGTQRQSHYPLFLSPSLFFYPHKWWKITGELMTELDPASAVSMLLAYVGFV